MSKTINLLLLVVGLILVGFGLAALRDHPGSWLWVLVGIAVAALALFSDERRKRRADQLQRAELPARVDELMRQVSDKGRPVQVPMPLRLVLFEILAILVGSWLLYLAGTATGVDWRYWVGGAFFLGLGLLGLPYVWSGLGRPAIEFTVSGIATPRNGRIAWRDITGIFLKAVTYRGATTHTILFRVNNLARAAQRTYWTDRLLASFHRGPLFRNIVGSVLPRWRENPEVVYALARRLWKRATGSDYDWNPLMSDRFNAASQRLATVAAHLQEPGAIEPSTANLRQVERQMAQARDDIGLMRKELKRKRTRSNWIMGSLLLVALLAMAASVTLRLLTH